MGMRRDMQKSARVLMVATVCCLGLAASAAAAIIHVDCHNTSGTEDGSVAHPYSTIGEGVAAAAASGDTIQVAACVYREAVTIDSKNLHLLGANPETTTIRGGDNVIEVKGTGSVEVEGFTIEAGSNAGVLFNSAPATGSVHNCIIASNRNGVWAVSGGRADV